MKRLMIFFSFLFSFQSWALEIDEKLTTRFLKVSRTKKTALINRGLEDGLVVGDHAKFFLTTGVIARGVIVKASPTRSIWSIYRIIDKDSIYPDKAVNIKISTPVRVTDDPTKSLKGEVVPAGTEVVVNSGVEQSSTLSRESLSDEEKRDIESLGVLPNDIKVKDGSGVSYGKTLEFYGLVHLNSLSSSIDQGNNGSFNGEAADVDWSVGIEKYFNSKGSFLANISLKALIHSSIVKVQSIGGQVVSNSVFEYGIGGSWHFMADPLSYRRLIGFADFTLGVGKATDVAGNAQLETSEELSGSSSFFSLGIGLKYYAKLGLGARALVSYYRRSESYAFEATDSSFTKISAGPRLLLGLSYRW